MGKASELPMRLLIMTVPAYNMPSWKLCPNWRICPNGVACIMRVSIFSASIIAAIFVVNPTAFAQDLVEESVPNEWIQDYLPEKLPELKYPEYYNDLDKAREQVYRGRYKTALMTLRKIEKADAAQVALIKASALSALGRREEALAALSEAAVAENPKVQVLKARTLGELGKWDEGIALLKKLVEKTPDSVPARY